jgi:hypothetical protein
MRILAVDKIPGLLHCLSAQAINTSRVLDQKAKEVHETAKAIEELTIGPGVGPLADNPGVEGRRLVSVPLTATGKPRGGKW